MDPPIGKHQDSEWHPLEEEQVRHRHDERHEIHGALREDLGPAFPRLLAPREQAPDQEARGECLFLCGDAALRGGQLDVAEPAFTEALAIGGEHRDDALMGLAWSRVEREDLAGAMQRFVELISRHGDSALVPKARLEVGRLHYREGVLERLNE